MERNDDVMRILEIPRNYFGPGAVDSIYQEVVRFLRYRRTDRSIDVYIAEFDLLLRKSGPK